ncbi:hypothetical protein L9F63_013954, partial [Diploptera punctata]
ENGRKTVNTLDSKNGYHNLHILLDILHVQNAVTFTSLSNDVYMRAGGKGLLRNNCEVLFVATLPSVSNCAYCLNGTQPALALGAIMPRINSPLNVPRLSP